MTMSTLPKPPIQAAPEYTLHYGEQCIAYHICYLAKPMQKIAIHVYPNAAVQVDAPTSASVKEIKHAVQKRARWIVKHVQAAKEQQRHILPRSYVSGETHFYLGRRYQLKVQQQKEESVKLIGGKIIIHTQEKTRTHTRQLLKQWYKARCHDVFTRRLATLTETAPWIKNSDIHWKLLTMRKQWGSCSAKGVLSLNPHLVKAPRDCIDYVLLHELAHIKEHNHSKRFYNLLNRYMPDWEARKTKLDGLAGLLVNE